MIEKIHSRKERRFGRNERYRMSLVNIGEEICVDLVLV